MWWCLEEGTGLFAREVTKERGLAITAGLHQVCGDAWMRGGCGRRLQKVVARGWRARR